MAASAGLPEPAGAPGTLGSGPTRLSGPGNPRSERNRANTVKFQPLRPVSTLGGLPPGSQGLEWMGPRGHHTSPTGGPGWLCLLLTCGPGLFLGPECVTQNSGNVLEQEGPGQGSLSAGHGPSHLTPDAGPLEPPCVAGRRHPDILLSVPGLRRTHRFCKLQPAKVGPGWAGTTLRHTKPFSVGKSCPGGGGQQ